MRQAASAGITCTFPCLQEHIDRVPLYAHIKEILCAASDPGLYSEALDPSSSEGGQVEALEINYLTFYAYNGPYNVGGFRLVQTGDHDGDWEHVTARWGAGSLWEAAVRSM